jgi:hypothetical protein
MKGGRKSGGAHNLVTLLQWTCEKEPFGLILQGSGYWNYKGSLPLSTIPPAHFSVTLLDRVGKM